MWRFSKWTNFQEIWAIWISIHQMWRFSVRQQVWRVFKYLFQYIKCDGSALTKHLRTSTHSNHFNTSNVTVQRNALLYIERHRMDFNTSNVTVQLLSPIILLIRCHKFQYIKCDGSACAENADMPQVKHHFNTSNVTVQRQQGIHKSFYWKHFNTSNVTVQLDVLITR